MVSASFFFSSRRRHTRLTCDWSSDVCSSDLMPQGVCSTFGTFLQELDDAVSRGSAESRANALWHATDLLIAGRYSEDQIWAFGEVIGRLAEEIELTARVRLAKLLARAEQAPTSVINKLAFDS